MSHRRRRNLERKVHEERIAERERRERAPSRAARNIGVLVGFTARQFNQAILLAGGGLALTMAAIPWTTSLMDRALFALWGFGLLGFFALYRRMIRGRA